MVSIRMKMDPEDFYNDEGETKFVDRMALFLGIPTDKLKIVDVRKGSTIVDLVILIDEETKEALGIDYVTSVQNPSNETQSQMACSNGANSILNGIEEGTLDLPAPVMDISYKCSTVERVESKAILNMINIWDGAEEG